MKKILTSILLCLFFFFVSAPVSAQENNKVGISLLQPTIEDFLGAAELVNGPSGDWGYVTLVIQENDRELRKWQDIFEQLREKHLIPIIRLATSPQGEVWRRPEKKDAKGWVEFLDKLNWVVQERYVVLFNEPNHASEWGGEVDPDDYSDVALAFAQALKKSSDDYVVMLAGLDAAAPSYPPQYEDSGVFIRRIFQETGLGGHIDAWASHSYPNPGFSGSVWDSGKKSIRGYEYELDLLQDVGVEKNLPVFITETGWSNGKLAEATIAENNLIAFEQIWGRDNRIQAITPFVYKYLAEPFIAFSWKREGGYSVQYDRIKEMKKTKGMPKQIQKGNIEITLPNTLIARSTYHFPVFLKNTGQAIWSQEEGYTVSIEADTQDVKTLVSDVSTTKPFEEDKMSVTIKTPPEPQTIHLSLLLKKNEETIIRTKTYAITVEPLPELTIRTSLFPKLVSNGEGFEVQLFNAQEEMVFSKKGLTMRRGVILVENVSDIIPGSPYRVVLLGYPYLPRQVIAPLKKGKNGVKVKIMFPFDTNGDGKWDLSDIQSAIQNPGFFLNFIPWYRL